MHKKRFVSRVIFFVMTFVMISVAISPMKVYAAETSQVERITVQEKMDQLLDRLGVTGDKTAYFTKNQKPCNELRRESGHGCSNCSNSAVVGAVWLKEAFGNVNINASLFPSHDVNAVKRNYLGSACFGFACFAQWYLYADTNTENLVGKRVATINYNKNEVVNNVKPGDVLRIKNEHSVLVYSVEPDGVMVIDCNYGDGSLNCKVQKHLIPYTGSYYSGGITYVNRVTKTADIPAGMAGLFDVKEKVAEIVTPVQPDNTQNGKQYGTLDLSSTTWTTYNVGLDVEMNANKVYPLKHGAKLEILGKYTNSKGNEIYHVYSVDLKMNCYITAKYVKLVTLQNDTTDKDTTTDTTEIVNKVTGWIKDIMGRWFFVNQETGNKEKGWFCDVTSKLWYYLSEDDGYMLSDRWFCDPESGRWYYLDKNGAMCTGWIKVDGKQYYLDKNGAMCTGWNMLDGIWYLLGGDGTMLTGWQKVGGKYYYMTEDGKCLINTTTPDGYKVDGSGARIE